MYIGTDVDDQDFLVFLQTLIMSEPKTDAELKENNEGKYYPFGYDKKEQQNAYIVYSGNRQLPAYRAKRIKKHFNTAELKGEFAGISGNSKQELAAWLTTEGHQCSYVNLGDTVNEYLHELIWKMAGAENELGEPLSLAPP